MEQYKALFIYAISEDQTRKEMREFLEQNLFEPLDVPSTYGLPLEAYQVKVQQARALLRDFCRENLAAEDRAFFYESRMNEERNLSVILRSNLLEDE